MAEKIIVMAGVEKTSLSFVGQENIWHQLLKIFQNNRVANAYLFHGPQGSGKEGFAIRFASLLNCQHPSTDSCGVCLSCLKFKRLQHSNITLVIPFPKDRDISKNDPPEKALSDKTINYLQELIDQKGEDPYVKITLPRANTILINSIRHLREKIYLKALEFGRKMILIFDAHKLMTQQAPSGNALLKLLEEPPENTTFILTTDYPDQLAETIRSRCQSIYFPPVSEEKLTHFLMNSIKMEKTEAHIIAHLSQGDVRLAKNLAMENLDDLDSTVTSLIEWITSNSELGWRNFFFHGISIYRSDPDEFLLHMKLLSYWFLDTFHIQKANGQAELILSRNRQKIEDFSERYPSANFPAIVSAIEMCRDSLSRNFNINLVMINLLLDIEENLTGSRRQIYE